MTQTETIIELEKEIKRLQKLASMGMMIGNIAHQWRQPLNVISSSAGFIKLEQQMDSLSTESLYESCDSIVENAFFLSNTIEDFSDFIKGNRKKELFNIEKNINSFLNLIKGVAKTENIDIVLNLTKDLQVDAYYNELIQCYLNLYNNSQDAFIELNISKRVIFISAEVQNNKIVIKFKDNANGIPQDVIPNIFNEYFSTKAKKRVVDWGCI